MSKSKPKNIIVPEYEPSQQLSWLIQQLKITNMRDLIDPEITNDKLDQLLNMIILHYLMLLEIAHNILNQDTIILKQ